MACHLLDAFVAPALAAHRYVTVVASDFHLGPIFNKVAVGVYSCVDDGFLPAVTCGLYLINGIGKLEQAPRALEEVAFEICAQTVAYHVATVIIYYTRELVNLFALKELGLVDKKPVNHRHLGLKHFLGEHVKVSIRQNPPAFTLDADA